MSEDYVQYFDILQELQKVYVQIGAMLSSKTKISLIFHMEQLMESYEEDYT